MNNEEFPMNHAGMAADFDLQKQYFEEGKVYNLQIESTLRCPQLCQFCYAGSKPESIDGMTSGKIREILDSAASMEVRMIDWLGGDPLVRSDWYELCTHASNLGLINNIWTSGIPLDSKTVAKKAVEATKGGFISVHLDTLDPELYVMMHCDETRQGDSGNIHKILMGVKNCLDLGKDPGAMVNCITFTSPLAGGDAKATISYFQEKLGIKTCLTIFKPVMFNDQNPDWEPSLKEVKENIEFRDALNYPDDPSCGPMDVSKFYCGASVCVTGEGWLVPCSVIRTREFGNVNDAKLEALVEKNRRRLLYLDFRELKNLPGKCSQCTNNCNCFGCRSNAYYYNGDIMAEDPKCYHFTGIELETKEMEEKKWELKKNGRAQEI